MANIGIRRYSGDEAGNIFLGQTGFDVIYNGGSSVASTKGSSTQWVAIKALGAATVKGLSNTGDHLTVTGLAGGGAVSLADGDIVYGTFYDIDWGSGVLLAYKG